MTIPNTYFPSTTSEEPSYRLACTYARKYTYLKMEFTGSLLHTCEFSATLPVLKKNLPSIFNSSCFNEYNLPFRQEVRDTEMGHLFEHILLEYLCMYSSKYYKGGDAMFRGETKWNWKADPRGVFHIYVSSDITHIYAFKKALARAIELINKIIRESEIKPANSPAPAYVPARN